MQLLRKAEKATAGLSQYKVFRSYLSRFKVIVLDLRHILLDLRHILLDLRHILLDLRHIS